MSYKLYLLGSLSPMEWNQAQLTQQCAAGVVAGAHAKLVAALGRDDRLAAVGAKTLTQEQPPRIHTVYGLLTYHGPLVQQQGWFEPDISKFKWRRRGLRDGLLRRPVPVREIGLDTPESGLQPAD